MAESRDSLWNKGVEAASEKNWEKAIEYYEKANDIETHAYLLTNLAECYSNLKNEKKRGEYYKSAHNLLLNMSDIYDLNPFKNYINYLFNKKQYKDSKKLVEKVLESDKGKVDSSIHFTASKIYQKLKDNDNRYLSLMKAYKINPEDKEISSAYKKSVKKIEKIWDSYITNLKIEDKVREMVLEKNGSDNIADYFLDKTQTLPSEYFYNTDTIIRFIYQSTLELNYKYIVNIINYAFKKDYTYNAVSYFKNYNLITEEKFDIIIDIANKGNITLVDLFKALLNNASENKYREILEKMVKKHFIPDNTNDLKTLINTIYNDNSKKVLAKTLLDYDYDQFIPFIESLISNSYITSNVNHFINLIKDEETVKDILIDRVDKWVEQHGKPANFKNKIKPIILDYFENGTKTDDFSDLMKKFGSKFSKYSSIFYEYFLRNLDEETPFYERVLNFSLEIDLYKTLENMFNYRTDKEVSRDKIDYLIDKKVVDYSQLGEFFAERLVENSYYKILGSYLEEVAKIDFDAVIEGISRASAATKAVSLKYLWNVDKEKSYKFIMKMAGENSKKVREAVVKVLSGYKDGFEDYKELLKKRKQSFRVIGVELLASIDDPETVVPILEEHYKKEKASEPKYAIERYFKELEEKAYLKRLEDIKQYREEDFEKEALIYSNENRFDYLKNLKWLNIEELDILKWEKTDKKVSKELIYHLLNIVKYESDKLGTYLPNDESKTIIALINKKSLEIFSDKLFDFVIEDITKNRWCFLIISKYSSNLIEDKLIKVIDDMVKSGKTTGLYSVMFTLALRDSYKSFKFLNRLYKKSNIYDAYNALSRGLDELNYSYQDKKDILIPDFGFESDGTMELNYGPRSFTLTLTPDLKFTVVDNKGKKFKNLPKPAKKDDPIKAKESYEYIKTIKSEMKDLYKIQKGVLEKNMISGRVWKKKNWINLFSGNPIMKQFAMGLVWGEHDSDNNLISTFRYMEDGTFNNIDDEEYNLSDNSLISLLHPIDLSKDQIDLWKEQFEDYEIIQPFNQLERITYRPTEEDLEKDSIDDFIGYMVIRISLKSKLYKYGWTYGSIEDGGCYYEYLKYIGDYRAEIEFLGDYAGGSDKFSEVPVKQLRFYKNNNLLKIKDVPMKVLSEIYYEVKTVVDGGSGYNEDWENVSW